MAITKISNSGFGPSMTKYDDFLAGNPAYYPPSFESIATVTGTGSSGTVTFSSIPSGYKALQIRYIGKSTQTGTAARYLMTINLNNDTGTNYTRHALRGDGSTVAATGTASTGSLSTSYTVIPNSATAYANMHGVGIIDIIDYTSTTKAKTIRGFAGEDVNVSAAGMVDLFSGLYFATPTAITQIDLTTNTGSWTTTSSFALYGIK